MVNLISTAHEGVLDAAVVDIKQHDMFDVWLTLEIRRSPFPLPAAANDADADLLVCALDVRSRDGAGGGERGFEEGAAFA